MNMIRQQSVSNTFGHWNEKIIYVQNTLLICKLLHLLPNFPSKSENTQVRNGQFVSVLFILPVILDICHRFEAFTSVSEIHEM